MRKIEKQKTNKKTKKNFMQKQKCRKAENKERRKVEKQKVNFTLCKNY